MPIDLLAKNIYPKFNIVGKNGAHSKYLAASPA